jgi:GGDEF domain-containing protein
VSQLARRLLPLVLIVPPLAAWALVHGPRPGLFSPETGVTVMITVTCASLLGGVFWCAQLLRVLDGERGKAREEIRSLSLADEVTGLRSGRAFLELARQQILISRRLGQSMLVCYIALEGASGAEGEKPHCDFATVLRRTFRESDIIARLERDVFAVLAINTTEAQRLEAGIVEAVERYNAVTARSVLNASIGMSFCNPASRADIESLLREADEKRRETSAARSHADR